MNTERRFFVRSLSFPNLTWATAPTLSEAEAEYLKHNRSKTLGNVRRTMVEGPADLVEQVTIDDTLTIHAPKGVTLTTL